MKSITIKSLIVVFLVGLLGFVCQQDYKDAIQQENHYCEMVKAGFWPEFKKNVQCNHEF